MYKTKILKTRTHWVPVENKPGYIRPDGEEHVCEERIIPDFARDDSDEVLEELGDDKQYIIAGLCRLNKEMDNKKLLAYAKNFRMAEIINKICDIYYRGVVRNSEDARSILGLTDEEVKSRLFANKWCIVTRSFLPPKGIPWKQLGRRTFCWVVPMSSAYENTGRRIECGGDITVFNTRKEALNELYKD